MSQLVRWPHQTWALEQLIAEIAKGHRRIIIQSPTGGGKGQIIEDAITHYLNQLEQVALYLNRKILIDQSARNLVQSGIEFGIRAAGHQDEWEQPVQVASMQTQQRREQSLPIHKAKLVILDEAHMGEMKGKRAKAIIKKHLDMGAVILMVTATPLDMQDMADVLIQAGTNSELRACGALVPAIHYGASEPDFKALKKRIPPPDKQLSEAEVTKAIMTMNIFGLVFDKWKLHNPGQRPTLLFAPGVEQSLGFAKDFWNRGISSAHIDGDTVWVNGEFFETSPTVRKQIFDQHKAGKIQIICSCYVMREGVNLPWVECLIFATIVTSLKSYLQMGGRGLRASPSTGKTHLIVIDHGGHWWRLGSLNIDRKWYLNWTSSAAMGMREELLRSKKCANCSEKLGDSPKCEKCGHINEIEPYRCPKCEKILNGRSCGCGHVIPIGRRSRMICQQDGTMVEHFGDLFTPVHKQITQAEADEKKWEKAFYQAKNSKSKMTFAQAIAFFAANNGWKWPSENFKLMPKYLADKFRRVCDVPRDRLK